MANRVLGMTLPMERGNNGYFGTTTNILAQLRANLTNLLLTKKGERMMQPNFGCNIHLVVFEAQTDDGLAEVRASIESAVQEWMPFLTVENVQVSQDPDYNRVYVRMTFRLLTDPTTSDSIVLVF